MKSPLTIPIYTTTCCVIAASVASSAEGMRFAVKPAAAEMKPVAAPIQGVRPMERRIIAPRDAERIILASTQILEQIPTRENKGDRPCGEIQ